MLGWCEDALSAWVRGDGRLFHADMEAGPDAHEVTFQFEVKQRERDGRWTWTVHLDCELEQGEDPVLLAARDAGTATMAAAKRQAVDWVLHLDGCALDVLVDALTV